MVKTCPNAGVWQALLCETDLQGQPTDLCDHLETCMECQKTLEIAAAEAECWQEAAQALSPEHQAASQEPALQEAMGALKGMGATQPPEGEHSGDNLPPCLEPAERPGLLGHLGTYEVHEVIGRGGMGVVFKAFDPVLHRQVAIKVLISQLAGNGTARQRFVREARAAAAVSHDHVLTIHAVEEANGLPYLVMPYVAGQALQEKLDQVGPLPVVEIVRIGMQTASALAAAHAQGLIHRDVKPANILLENGVERVKLTDFGLAWADDDAAISREGAVAGTPEYMSPEQARGEAVDHRSDLFSLGSVLYAMCTGKPPFRGGSSLAVLRRVCDDAPRPIRELNPEIPEWLETLVRRLLAKDPAARFATAAEVATLLEQHLARLRLPALALGAPLVAPPSPPGRKDSKVKLRHWLLAASVLLMLSLTVSEAMGVTRLVAGAATILRFRTAEGILILEIDDPQIRVDIDAENLLITGAGPHEVRLRPGTHRLQAARDGVPVQDEIFTITRGGKQVLRVRAEEKAAAAPPKPLPGLSGGFQIQVDPNATPVRARPPVPRPTEGKVFDQPIAIWAIPEMSPSCGMFSPDGKMLAAGIWDGTAILFDVTTGKKRAVLRTAATQLRALAIAPDGKTLAIGTGDGIVRLCDATSGQFLQELRGHSGSILGLAFSPDGATLASCGGNWDRRGELHLWDTKTGKASVLVPAFDNRLWSVAFAPDGKAVAVAVGQTVPGQVAIVSSADGKTVATYPLDAYGRHVAFSPDGKQLAVSFGENGMTAILDARTGAQQVAFQANLKPVFSLAYLDGGKRLLTSGVDGTAVLWDLEAVATDAAGKKVRRPARIATFLGHQGTVYFAAVSPDGKTLATGAMDRTIRLWDISGLLPGAKDQ